MNIKQLLILFTIFTATFNAQPKIIEVIKLTENIEGEYYYPKFIENNSSVIFSASNYKGLYRLDVDSRILETISTQNGAGYNPLILDKTNQVFYKTYKLNKGKKVSSINSYDFKTKSKKIISANKRKLKLPYQLPSEEILFVENSEIKNKKISKETLSKDNSNSKAVYVENNNLYLIDGNKQKVLNPLGKGVYVWESLSDDGEKIIFTFGNKGAFICNLKGEILHQIPNAHYPRISPDGKYLLYMKDADDGYKYTASDIYIYSLDDEKSFALTETENQIEMYAEWSKDGKSIVYNTTEGKIILAKLKYEN